MPGPLSFGPPGDYPPDVATVCQIPRPDIDLDRPVAEKDLGPPPPAPRTSARSIRIPHQLWLQILGSNGGGKRRGSEFPLGDSLDVFVRR